MLVGKVVSGDIILAENVDFETYLHDFLGQHAEWIAGTVIKMSPVSITHDKLNRFLQTLIGLYLEQTREGDLCGDNVALHIGEISREPDLIVLTSEHLDRLKDTYVEGPADLVVEIISPESFERDRGTKFREYEQAGVREYWLIDPVHDEALFYVLDDDGHYKPNRPDSSGIYTSATLPRLRISTQLLLQSPPPSLNQAVELVREMLS